MRYLIAVAVLLCGCSTMQSDVGDYLAREAARQIREKSDQVSENMKRTLIAEAAQVGVDLVDPGNIDNLGLNISKLVGQVASGKATVSQIWYSILLILALSVLKWAQGAWDRRRTAEQIKSHVDEVVATMKGGA